MTNANAQPQPPAAGGKEPPAKGKGKAFFDRGDQVAETGNWDFAIQMYLHGIRREPANVERGHRPLWEAAMKRKAGGGGKGGKGLLDGLNLGSLMGQFKGGGSKDPVEVLVAAEHALVRDMGNVSHMVTVLKAAQQLNEPALIKWIADLLVMALREAKKPSRNICVMVAEALTTVEAYREAASVCDLAIRFYPDDGQLSDMVRNLSARATIQQGQYDGEGTFLKSVKDMKKQMELNSSDQLRQSREYKDMMVERARKEYEADPTVPGKIDALVEALTRIEEEGYENEAIDVLKKATADTHAYRFKVRLDDIKIKQMQRRYRALKADNHADEAKKLAQQQLVFELEVYAERAANYPTDLNIKFELGRRLMIAGKIDDAIGALQQAQRDPKRRLQAMAMLGQAFDRKGWYQQAISTYERALETDPPEERSKELNYNLASALEKLDQNEKALEHFSRVAQLDYNYKDVKDRIEALRKKTGSSA